MVVFNTFVIERNFAVARERAFRAFSDPQIKRRWFADGHGPEMEEFTLDFRVGGAERARYRMGPATPFPGARLDSQGVILEIIDNERLIMAGTMAMEGRRFSASMVTFEFRDSATGGTELICTHQGAFFEHSDGPEMRQAGWMKLLDQLGRELAA